MSTHTLTLDPQGWITPANKHPSPNYNQRPANTTIDCIIIHAISLPPYPDQQSEVQAPLTRKWVLDLFDNKLDPNAHPYFSTIATLRVSSHFLIDREGELFQLVSTDHRAWHAGASTLAGRDDCNNYSIGIELIGADTIAFEKEQYQSLRTLIACLQQHYPTITKDRVVGHCHVAPNRKTDPGPFFDWDFLNKT